MRYLVRFVDGPCGGLEIPTVDAPPARIAMAKLPQGWHPVKLGSKRFEHFTYERAPSERLRMENSTIIVPFFMP